jgi:hypothetical protein
MVERPAAMGLPHGHGLNVRVVGGKIKFCNEGN